MTRTLAVLVSLVLAGAFASTALAQTDEELREMYFRRDHARMEEIAQAGDARAEAWLGLIRQNAGRREEAKVWYRRAAEKGSRSAIVSLADMHRWDKEQEEALYWYRRGAELGISSSQMTLAWLLLEGNGYPKDEREAFRLYSSAAARGHRGAYLKLAHLHADGRGTERNAVEAYALTEIAETVLDPLSDGDQVQTAKALKARLGQELQPDGIAHAVGRAREIRSDLDAIRDGRQRVGYFLWGVAGAILVAVFVCILAAVFDFVGLVRSGSRGG
jgi:Sel1 repeat-containing protein